MPAFEPVVQAMEADWEQAALAWRDWREAITRHYDERANMLLEQAWAAGLLDSEATFGHEAEAGETPPERVLLMIRQPGGERGRMNLVRFQRAVEGAGFITGPYNHVSPSPYFLWHAATEEDIEQVWLALGPFLGPVKFSAFRKALVVSELRQALAGTRPAEEAPRRKSSESPRRKMNRAERRAAARAATERPEEQQQN